MRKALITGITGQDGSYLAELLLSKGYEVHGLVRRASTLNTGRLDHLSAGPHHDKNLFLHFGDLADAVHIVQTIYDIKPDEVYNLAAQSHVRVSFDIPEYTGDIVGLGATRLLESIRRSGIKAKFYQASSSEMFGATPPPQNEMTSFYPRSPYAAAKVHAFWLTVNYRESYNLFACNGILFNHESPRRGETFVTRKITMAMADILAGKQDKLFLGNLDAKRDWGFAPEYVECQWRMLQQDKPEDFVIGTGESHTVREFADLSFSYAGVELEWKGNGVQETGIIRSVSPTRASRNPALKPGTVLIEIDPQLFRPTEVDFLLADPSKAKKLLDWEPKVAFNELVRIMVDADMESAGVTPPGEGTRILQARGITWTKNT